MTRVEHFYIDFRPHWEFGVKAKPDVIKIVMATVCEYFKISEYWIRSRSRDTEIKIAKHVLRYFLFRYQYGTLKTIGDDTCHKSTKGFNHATILHSVNKFVPNQLDTDRNFRDQVIELKDIVDTRLRNGLINEPQKVTVIGAAGYSYVTRMQKTEGHRMIVTLIFEKNINK